MRYSEGLDTTGVSDLALGWGHDGTRPNQGSRIIYITEKPVRQHHQSMRIARLLGYWLRLACSGWPAGFIFTCFYLSKLHSEWTVTTITYPPISMTSVLLATARTAHHIDIIDGLPPWPSGRRKSKLTSNRPSALPKVWVRIRFEACEKVATIGRCFSPDTMVSASTIS